MAIFDGEYFFDGYETEITPFFTGSIWIRSSGQEMIIESIINASNGIILEYHMRGRDIDCGILTYRYWTTIGFPDINAANYVGPKCGPNPLADITITSIVRK